MNGNVTPQGKAPQPESQRTPLHDIANLLRVPNDRYAAAPVHKSVLALRSMECGKKTALPQVQGQTVHLATSPMSIKSIPMRSPMVGRTPEDMKRSFKRTTLGPASVITMIPSRQPGSQPMIPQPAFTFAESPLKDSSGVPVVNCQPETAFALPAPTLAPSDPVKEAARLKKLEAKARREAKAALKAQKDAERLAEEQRKAVEHAALVAKQTANVLAAINDISGTEDCEFENMEPIRKVSWKLLAIGQCLAVLAPKLDLYPVELPQIDDALRTRKTSLETENILTALNSSLLAAARGDVTKAAKRSSSSSWMADLKKWAHAEMGTHSPFIDATLIKQKKEGALEYKHLSSSQKLDLLHELCAAALSRILAAESPSAPADSEQSSDPCSFALRPTPLGSDSEVQSSLRRV